MNFRLLTRESFSYLHFTMKKLFSILLLAFLCAIPARATDVTISASQQSNLSFNPANIGVADQSITVTATNGSATVTSSNAFPQTIVGRAGFQVLLGGVQYVVAGVASRSSLTLTTTFGGSTGSTSMTLYKFVILRIYCNQAFTPLNANYVVQAGAVGSASFYKEVGVSILNPGTGNIAYYPEFTLPATTDAPVNNTAQYTFAFYNANGGYLNALYACDGGITQFSVPPATPTSFINLCSYNGATAIRPDASTYTRTQIDARFPSCSQGQSYYFAANGNIVSCLTFDPVTLQLSGGTLSVVGGGGGGSTTFTATQVSTNYTILTTDWLVSVNTAGGSRTATLYAAAGNSGRLVSVCKATTDVNTVTISDGVTTIGTLYAPTSCLQMMSNGTNWILQSY